MASPGALGAFEPSFLKVEVVKHPKYKILWLLNVTVPKDAPVGIFQGNISICDRNGVKKINLPVRGTVSNLVQTASSDNIE